MVRHRQQRLRLYQAALSSEETESEPESPAVDRRLDVLEEFRTASEHGQWAEAICANGCQAAPRPRARRVRH